MIREEPERGNEKGFHIMKCARPRFFAAQRRLKSTVFSSSRLTLRLSTKAFQSSKCL
jgi:hypothetical protein